MDAQEFRESVIAAIKYMAFFKKHACTFAKPIEVEFGLNGEKRKVIPTICFVEVPDEEEKIEENIGEEKQMAETVAVKRGLRSIIGAINDSISDFENAVAAVEVERNLPTKESYVNGLHVPSYDFREWSDPMYQCSECGGGMCKNLRSVCACLPPKYEYRCNKCGHTDYLPQ